MRDSNFCNSHCPLTRAVGAVGNKWKPLILHVIRERTIRFGQLDAIIPIITRKVLTEQLKELEEDEIILRVAYNELPRRVEYSLTEKGLAFLPILDQMQEWNIRFDSKLRDKEKIIES